MRGRKKTRPAALRIKLSNYTLLFETIVDMQLLYVQSHFTPDKLYKVKLGQIELVGRKSLQL